ncbi:MAG: hypothetical protein A2806_01550 [Candidatus Terrybacteria bacterium RIFCSPHIGHO2_01_FULL_48_17]|uniref:Uncharacterized protein n=1 Tax=Candidatus Terrybacteria bacterium RIFCSPHIGHO2_01_FULL_48_17 TaxID=1802362 RepID=A0A1G2PMN8_9BACT|nr:MAG: hypothetical protein A2806_01550 [Candidatus Terrybacteria bacterium RIFCSPHIGHO2_01_FULL_48_17]OHA52705.1 MAG: hypothetical protein A3A30_03750 [Candidatus Terrybacteria bacterium RIFCSPLOWO2_01_FULL_48_14]
MISKASECEIFVMRGGIDKNHLRAIHGPRFILEAENCARRALNVALRRAAQADKTKARK